MKPWEINNQQIKVTLSAIPAQRRYRFKNLGLCFNVYNNGHIISNILKKKF